MSETLLTRPEVERRVRLSRSSLYRKMHEGTFPVGIKVGERAVRWSSEEVEAWLAERPKAFAPGP